MRSAYAKLDGYFGDNFRRYLCLGIKQNPYLTLSLGKILIKEAQWVEPDQYGKYHNHRLQANPWHHEENIQNTTIQV